MKKIINLSLALFAFMSTGIQAQGPKEIAGVRHVSAGVIADSNATFAIGMSLDGGTSFVETARVGDAVVISGIVRPEPGHVGQPGDIFLVEKSDQNTFTMRTADGDYDGWNGSVPSLVPFLDNQVLTAAMNVEFFSGQLGVAGDKRLYLGYVPADGILRFTPSAARLDITTASVRDEAMAMFATSISSSIVQNRCVLCHASGGPAEGRSIHQFVRASNPDHLQINFVQFENLIKEEGSAYVLSKVRGGLNHEGSDVFIGPGADADFNNLSSFLLLLEGLAAETSDENPGSYPY